MPNIFKHFSKTKAELYQFPNAEELAEVEEEPSEEEESSEETSPEGKEPSPPLDQEEEEQEEPSPETNPVNFAQIQADKILEDARRQAKEILAQAQQNALREAEDIRALAYEGGQKEGYAQGLSQAHSQAAQELEQRAAVQKDEVQKFLDRAQSELDRQLDMNIDELRDLAIAIAEKVICVSLKSSGDVISRMIQTAVEKRKRREWVHIYIAECDAKLMGQAPASLVKALSAVSGRVRIVPIAGDESGTCLIETPDEIIDASAATQLNNLRNLLMDAAAGGDADLTSFNF